jgi:hypothetical protein
VRESEDTKRFRAVKIFVFIMGLQHEDYSHLDRQASTRKQALLLGTVFIITIRYEILLIKNAKQAQASTSKWNFLFALE